MKINRAVSTRFASITILGFIALFSFSFTNPILSLFALSVNTSGFLLAIIFLISSMIQVFIRPIFGSMIDVYGRLKLIPISIYLYALSQFIWYSSTDPVGVFVGQITLSLAASIFWTTTLSYVPEIVKTRDKLGLALGIAWTITDTAAIIAPTLGGYVAQNFSYRIAFLIDAQFTAIAGTIFLIVLFHFEKKYGDKERSSEMSKSSFRETLKNMFEGLKIILKNTRIRASLTSVFMVGMAIGLFGSFYPVLVKQRGNTETEIGLTFSGRSVSLMMLRIPGGTLADKYNKTLILVFTTFLLGLVLFLIPLSNSFVEFLIWMALSGVATGIFLPTAQALILQNVDEEKKGLAMGVWGSFFQMSNAIGFILMSIIIVFFNIEMMFYLFSFIIFGGAGLLIISWNKARRKED